MVYSTRHFERDEKLPEIRKALLIKMIDQFKSKGGIEGIFAGGSIAKGNDDLYSDIDLRIVVAEDQFDRYVENKKLLLAEFGRVDFYEDMNPQAPFTIAHYANFIKVDLFIYTFDKLSPSI